MYLCIHTYSHTHTHTHRHTHTLLLLLLLLLAGQTPKDEATIDMLFELSKDIAGKKDLVHEGAASDTVRKGGEIDGTRPQR